MKIIFRTDASVDIGSGHLMRCLTLADQLCSEGAEVAFVCRDLPGAMFGLLQARGYRNARLPFAEIENFSQCVDAKETIDAAAILFPGGFDWLVVDHYILDATWERMLRPYARKIMVIDDLANRQHDCDLLLDQNYYCDLEQRYKGLVPELCITLLGPTYVLLRREFAEARKQLRARDGIIRRILVFLGGSDPANITGRILDVLRQLSLSEITIDVVVGISNPHRHLIQGLCSEMNNAQYYCQVSNMAELIANADIAIGAGGATTWERCVLGLPSLTLVFADNQLQTTLDLNGIGAIKYLGWADKITSTDIKQVIDLFINNPLMVSTLSENALLIMKDWRGGQAILTEMLNIPKNNKGLQ